MHTITKNTVLELLFHEGIVREAYKDSKGIWTWGVGVTNTSGYHIYPEYLDNPQPLSHCIEVFISLLEQKYAPEVAKAFAGYDLMEEQFAAALSFHYNTGAIARATWVKDWKANDVSAAYHNIMNWRTPKSIIERREKERSLFFYQLWSNDGTSTEYSVNKNTYQPQWSSAKKVNIENILDDLLT